MYYLVVDSIHEPLCPRQHYGRAARVSFQHRVSQRFELAAGHVNVSRGVNWCEVVVSYEPQLAVDPTL